MLKELINCDPDGVFEVIVDAQLRSSEGIFPRRYSCTILAIRLEDAIVRAKCGVKDKGTINKIPSMEVAAVKHVTTLKIAYYENLSTTEYAMRIATVMRVFFFGRLGMPYTGKEMTFEQFVRTLGCLEVVNVGSNARTPARKISFDGDWFMVQCAFGRLVFNVDGNGVTRDSGYRLHVRGEEEQQNNAQLIAAAPDLLIACKALLAIVEAYNPYWHGRTDGVDAMAKAAIAKAAGK